MIANHRGLIALLVLVNGGAMLAGVMLTQHSSLFALLPIGMYVAIAFGVFGFAVLSGVRWASGLLLVIVLVVFAINLRGEIEPGEKAQFDLVSASKLALYVVAFVSGLVAIERTYRTLLDLPVVLLSSYLALGIVTIPLSLVPDYSAGMAFALASWLLFAAALSRRFDTAGIIKLIIAAGAIFCVCSLVAYFLFPEYGRFVTPQVNIMRLKGLSSTPNEAGQIAAILLIAVLCFVLSGFHRDPEAAAFRKWLPFLCLPAAAVILMAGSRGALAALVVTATALLLQHTRLSRFAVGAGALVLMMGAALVLAVPELGDAAQRNTSIVSRSGSAEEVASLAGRANMWAFAIDRIGDRPVVGHGLGASRELILENYMTRWGERTGSAHNAFLQSALDLGLVGAVLLASVFAWSFWQFLYRPWPFRDGMFVFVLLTSLLESGISKPTSTLALIWLLSLMSAPRPSPAEVGDAAVDQEPRPENP